MIGQENNFAATIFVDSSRRGYLPILLDLAQLVERGTVAGVANWIPDVVGSIPAVEIFQVLVNT